MTTLLAWFCAFSVIFLSAVDEIMNTNDLRGIADSRRRECEIESKAFRDRLILLGRTNWLTSVLPAMLSLLIGATLLKEYRLIEDWKVLTAIVALVSAALVTLHKVLECDAYQAECRRLERAYGGLALEYRTLADLAPTDMDKRLGALDEGLAAVRKSASVNVPDRYRERARLAIEQQSNTA